MDGPFARRRDGSMDVLLSEPEVALLGEVAAQMEHVLADEEIAHASRLVPPAYRDDDEAQAEYARLTTGDLLDGKRQAIRSFLASVERGVLKRNAWRVRLSAEETQDWLAVMNDARLTLGTRLQVTEGSYERDLDPDDPDSAAHQVFRYLGYLEEWLVETVMG
jgi:hypothetical protein